MEVKLAGYNVDADALESACAHYNVCDAPLTPETLSAAYARISRDPAPVGELRDKACEDVAKARESNRTIVFGYGHASVAEHAVLNFDITGLSRLAIEALEHSRLCSYTEKSQRYQKLKDDYVVPGELKALGLEEDFRAIVAFQNEAYQQAYKAINTHLKKTMPQLEPAKRRGKAKEDARYLTSLAMEGQLGMTLNARNLEAMVRRLASHPLAEVRDLAVKLHAEGMKAVPSLLIYTGADPMRCDAPREIARAGWPAIAEIREGEREQPAVVLLGGGGESLVATMLMFETGSTSWGRCIDVSDANKAVIPKVFRAVFSHMGTHSAAPRAFEMVDFTFELTMSASCFAQMKRHRMATILSQAYEPELSPTMPESFADAGMEDLFREVTGMSADLCRRILKSVPAAAPYALTQAHRRRVLVRMNAREMYAFSRLRMDCHAQWDIRNLATQMVRQAQKRAPMLMAMACGKDEFDERKCKVMEALDEPDPYVSIRKI